LSVILNPDYKFGSCQTRVDVKPFSQVRQGAERLGAAQDNPSKLALASENCVRGVRYKGIQQHMDMQWLNQARCLNEDPELFFPVGNTGPAVDQIDQAKAVCRECAVSTSCLEYAIKENQDTGVWGGLSEDERKSLKRKYARARRAG
jgi:WhiB family redox-sensing transcriptional regulator